MDKFSLEVLNRFGEKMLSIVQKDFPNGFHIVGGDPGTLIVGDKTMNRAYSLKKLRATETVKF